MTMTLLECFPLGAPRHARGHTELWVPLRCPRASLLSACSRGPAQRCPVGAGKLPSLPCSPI